MKEGWLYLLCNGKNGTLYLGVTSNLRQRIGQHRDGQIAGFSKKYGCKTLVWTEHFSNLEDARRREWQMKKWKRAWKIELIEKDNPQWQDLFEQLNM